MFARISTLLKGFVSLFISGIEKSNPRALIEAEKENLRNQIARFNENLATHAGFVERLLRQVKSLETKEKEVTARVSANIKAGNRAVAGQLALELQTIKSQLEENRGQLTVSEETYKKLIKTRDVSIRDAKAKIETLKRMLSEAEMMEAQAELQEMASGMIGQIGGSGDTINRVEEYLTERRDKAAGRSRVAGSTIDTTEIQMKESEQVALADQALADFEMAYGMKAPEAEKPASSEAAAPNRELGPKQSN